MKCTRLLVYNCCVDRYLIPAHQVRSQTMVLSSRFIATLAPVFSVDEAKDLIARQRAEFADASHNVPAYIIGHGASLITHCSDDGEPSGTAGRPALAVLSGSGLGDAAVVVTRYFGGTKLGTGGLVRAYSDAVRQALAILPRAERIPVHIVMLSLPYNWFERLRLLVVAHHGELLEQDFTADITLTARFPSQDFPTFQDALGQASHGSLSAQVIGTDMAIVPIES